MELSGSTSSMELAAGGCLSLLWPALNIPELSADRHLQLSQAAAHLPAVPRLAVEFRLSDGGDIDLHQLFVADEKDPEILGRYLDRPAVTASFTPALTGFLTAWARNDRNLHAVVPQIFLEWDAPGGGEPPKAPGIFLPVDLRSADVAINRERREFLNAIVAELLADQSDEPVRGVPELFWDAASRGTTISHVGVMLGRGNAIRINYRGVKRSELGFLLNALSWPGDRSQAVARFDALVAKAGTVTVAFDFAGKVLPSIGFEVFFDHSMAWEPRWTVLLNEARAEGLCTEEKRATLSGIDADLRPYEEGQEWPASWIVATMRAPESRVPVVERRLSHLKWSIAAGGKETCKAYASAQHAWRPVVAVGRIPQDDKTVSRETACDRAVRFLLSSRKQNGWWTDFSGANGPGDEWISAVVGWALLRSQNPDGLAAAKHLSDQLLARQRASGGWAYNEMSPPDADSTGWVLRYLQALDRQDAAPFREATHFLEGHLLPTGGIATYGPGTPMRFSKGAISDEGWRTEHICVAANCAGLLAELLPHLESHQNPDGSWTPYWWRTRAYATGLAVEALAANGRKNAVDAAIGWARAQATESNSAFDTAWLCLVLQRGTDADKTQAALLIPSPEVLQPGDNTFAVMDDQRNYTTASVLLALSRGKGTI